MPVVGANSNMEQFDPNGGIAGVLNAVLSGVSNKAKDRAYRKSAAKLMGIPEEDLGYFSRAELGDLVKDKKKTDWGEWKPKTQEEAIAFESAKAGNKLDADLKKEYARYFNIMKTKDMPPEPFNKWKAMMDEGYVEPEPAPTQAPATMQEKADAARANPKSWDDVGLMGRIMSAITPSKTPEENALGKLRPGGILFPPKVGAESAPVAAAPAAEQFTPEEEALITQNMIGHGKSREEVVSAMKLKGYLKGK